MVALAGVGELVDTPASGAGAATRGGSSPSARMVWLAAGWVFCCPSGGGARRPGDSPNRKPEQFGESRMTTTPVAPTNTGKPQPAARGPRLAPHPTPAPRGHG